MQATAEQPLVNRVATSSLVTFKLEEFFPKEEMASFDLKDYLFMGLILKEKDFREALANHDWAQYAGKNLAVFCSADAIIPMWAYMLVATYAAPYARDIAQTTPDLYPEIARLADRFSPARRGPKSRFRFVDMNTERCCGISR